VDQGLYSAVRRVPRRGLAYGDRLPSSHCARRDLVALFRSHILSTRTNPPFFKKIILQLKLFVFFSKRMEHQWQMPTSSSSSSSTSTVFSLSSTPTTSVFCLPTTTMRCSRPSRPPPRASNSPSSAASRAHTTRTATSSSLMPTPTCSISKTTQRIALPHTYIYFLSRF